VVIPIQTREGPLGSFLSSNPELLWGKKLLPLFLGPDYHCHFPALEIGFSSQDSLKGIPLFRTVRIYVASENGRF
jgi:hypothetical protein